MISFCIDTHCDVALVDQRADRYGDRDVTANRV